MSLSRSLTAGRTRLLLGCLGLSAALGGPVRAGELHDVTTAPGRTTLGAPGKASVTLSAKNGWHLNPEAPVSLKLAPAAGVTVDKPKLTRKDLALSTAETARFDVAFQGAKAGPSTIECEANFVICQASACKPIKETVTLAVDVSDAAAAPAKAAGKGKKK